MENTCKITEIFESIQGEGLYIGQKHLFVRLLGCNYDCKYCDTKLLEDSALFLSKQALFGEISRYTARTVSFTGGEPLLQSEFLADFLKEYKIPLKKRIYLETNGVLAQNLREVIDYIDIVAMDIKIESSSGVKNNFVVNDEFLLVSRDKEVFAKVVYDENITDFEISEIAKLGLRHGIVIILQPKMPMNTKFDPTIAFKKLYEEYKNIRLIPQIHKYLDLP